MAVREDETPLLVDNETRGIRGPRSLRVKSTGLRNPERRQPTLQIREHMVQPNWVGNGDPMSCPRRSLCSQTHLSTTQHGTTFSSDLFQSSGEPLVVGSTKGSVSSKLILALIR